MLKWKWPVIHFSDIFLLGHKTSFHQVRKVCKPASRPPPAPPSLCSPSLTLKEISVVIVKPWVMTGSSSVVRPFQQSSSMQRHPDKSTCLYISTEEFPASWPAAKHKQEKSKTHFQLLECSKNNRNVWSWEISSPRHH